MRRNSGPADDGTTDEGSDDALATTDDGTGGGEDDSTGTTGADDFGETGAADCTSIADAATCMATGDCEWFGDDMFGACIGGLPGGTGGGFGTDGGFDFCEGFDMMLCDQTGFCVWNAVDGICESP